jgi:hypothetical protein
VRLIVHLRVILDNNCLVVDDSSMITDVGFRLNEFLPVSVMTVGVTPIRSVRCSPVESLQMAVLIV